MKNILFVLAFWMTMMACSSSKELKTKDLEKIGIIIDRANANYAQRFTREDAAYYDSLYTADAKIMPPEGKAIMGRDRIREFYYAGGRNKTTKITIQKSSLQGTKSYLIEEGSYDFPNSRGGSFDKGKFIAIWKKEKGYWKLFREIWNTDLPHHH